jgi:hypothetical protein
MRANSAKTIARAIKMRMAIAMRTGCGNRRTGDRSIALGMAWNANQSRNFPIPLSIYPKWPTRSWTSCHLGRCREGS